MLKLFLIITAVWAYIGLISSGTDGFVAQKGKDLYEYCVSVWDEVEIDCQIPESLQKEWEKGKDRSKRTRTL